MKLDKDMLKIHPKYLSNMRLLALWREGLKGQRQAQAGYPWKDFAELSDPVKGIGSYLSFIASEGLGRGLHMNHELIVFPNFEEKLIAITYEQLLHESANLNLPRETRLVCHPVYKLNS